MRQLPAVLLFFLLASFTGGCGSQGEQNELYLCDAAVAHLKQCTGMAPAVEIESCDPDMAELILSQDCDGTQRSIQSNDGSWWNDLLCNFGFYRDCGASGEQQPRTGRGTATPFPDGAIDLTGYRADPWTRQQFVTSFGSTRFAEYSDAVHDSAAQNPVYSTIPVEDLVAVRGYTSDVPKDSGLIPDYSQLNSALRKQDPTELARLGPYTKCASSGLNQIPEYTGIAYRRTNLPDAILATYKQGTFITERAFTSSSLELLESFQGNTIFLITSRHGREITNLSVYPKEREILFVPGTRFLVTLVDRKQAPTIMISMEEVR